MLKKTISVFILVAIITATIICGSLTVFAEETQGDCVVNYVDLDGNIVATQYYNFGDKITGLEAFDSYTQTAKLSFEQYGSNEIWMYYDEYSEFEINEIIEKLNKDSSKLWSNILSVFGGVEGSASMYYFINEQGDINDLTIVYSKNNTKNTVTFNELTFSDGYYSYSDDSESIIFAIELHDSYHMNFFSLNFNPLNMENMCLISIEINGELRYKDGISYKEMSKDELPQIYVSEMTFIVPYKAAPVPTPGDGDTDDEIDTDIADETTNPNILEKAKADWDNMWREIKAFFDKVGNWFRDTWQKISDFFHKLSDLNKNEDIDNDKSDAANNAALLRYSS